jgi:hypothetical protein
MKSLICGLSDGWTKYLPLLGGEGRGEGEIPFNQANPYWYLRGIRLCKLKRSREAWGGTPLLRQSGILLNRIEI